MQNRRFLRGADLIRTRRGFSVLNSQQLLDR
jgi:hypothetical protein